VLEGAAAPEDLARLFFARATAGDVEGVAAPCLRLPTGAWSGVRLALAVGDLALTPSRFPGGATAELARRQADGSSLSVIGQPRL
jgi:hypothetical protein